MSKLYNTYAPKKPTNLTVNSDLLDKAKSLKINISATLEQALIETIKKQQINSWKLENKEAIEEYNEFVAQYGLFSDKLRTF